MLRLKGSNIACCPECKKGKMRKIKKLPQHYCNSSQPLYIGLYYNSVWIICWSPIIEWVYLNSVFWHVNKYLRFDIQYSNIDHFDWQYFNFYTKLKDTFFRANTETGQAFDTLCLIDSGGFLFFPLNGIYRASPKTHATLATLLLIHFIPQKGRAAFRRTPFLKNMDIIFVTKVFQSW